MSTVGKVNMIGEETIKKFKQGESRGNYHLQNVVGCINDDTTDGSLEIKCALKERSRW